MLCYATLLTIACFVIVIFMSSTGISEKICWLHITYFINLFLLKLFLNNSYVTLVSFSSTRSMFLTMFYHTQDENVCLSYIKLKFYESSEIIIKENNFREHIMYYIFIIQKIAF